MLVDGATARDVASRKSEHSRETCMPLRAMASSVITKLNAISVREIADTADKASARGSRERWRGGQRGAARTDFPTGGTGLWTVVDVARMADRVSTTLVKATTDQSQADW